MFSLLNRLCQCNIMNNIIKDFKSNLNRHSINEQFKLLLVLFIIITYLGTKGLETNFSKKGKMNSLKTSRLFFVSQVYEGLLKF